jgi:hypothetical protein
MPRAIRKPSATRLLALTCVAAIGCAKNDPRCAENLHTVGLALLEFHDSRGAFPLAAISDKQGSPGLSWRVAILPYLGQKALYEKFKLDEPWDSAHNRALLPEIPAVFRCPSTTPRDPSLTTYQAFTGRGAFFEPPFDARFAPVWWTDPDGTKHYQTGPTSGSSMAAFTDGMANTLMLVETIEAVPWTKPEGLPFDPAKKSETLLGAGSPHREGINVVFANGAVRCLKTKLSPTVFRALITRSGDEVVNLDKL